MSYMTTVPQGWEEKQSNVDKMVADIPEEDYACVAFLNCHIFASDWDFHPGFAV